MDSRRASAVEESRWGQLTNTQSRRFHLAPYVEPAKPSQVHVLPRLGWVQAMALAGAGFAFTPENA